MFDEHNLQNMPRRVLQDLAKSNGVRANLKSAEIIKQLLSLEHVGNNDELCSENTDADDRVSKEVETTDDQHTAKHRDEVETLQSPEEPHLKKQQSDDLMSQIHRQDASPSNGLESAQDEVIPKQEINPQDNPPTDNVESDHDEAFPKREINHQEDLPTDKVESAQNDGFPESKNVNIASDDQESNKSQSAVLLAKSQSSTSKSLPDRTDSKLVSDPSNLDSESNNRSCSAENMEADMEDLSSETHDYGSENVQEALDTYRKIAMESAAAIHAHGCQIPESPASGSSRSVPGIKSQSLAVIQEGPRIKSESDSVIRSKFLDLQENPAESTTSAMTKGPISPISAPVLEDPSHLCLWSPSRMAERKKEFKNNEFGGTKRRLEGYMTDGRTKLTETVRDHRRAQGTIDVPDQ